MVSDRLADRDMTDEQTKQLSASLARLSGKTITILVVPYDAEAEHFAEKKIAASMKDTGLVASRVGGSSFGSQGIRGLGLAVRTSRQKDAAILRDAFSKAGISKEHIQPLNTGDSAGLELFIGPKN